MVWVNVDKPTNCCTIHLDSCRHVAEKRETEFKGIQDMKRDGGWSELSTLREAREFAQRSLGDTPDATVKDCADCHPGGAS